MARKRMIDPDIWQDEKLAQLDFAGRLFFIGLISQANDFGKLRGNSQILKSMIFPYEKNNLKIEKYLKNLSELRMIVLYQANGEAFIKIKNWSKYQKVEHPSKDNIPEPSGDIRETLPTLSGDLPAQDKLISISKDKLIECILSDLNSVLSTFYKPTSLKTQELIKARLAEGFTEDDFKQVHRNMLKRWGADNKMREFLRPITLYSNKFESYLNIKKDLPISTAGAKTLMAGKEWAAGEDNNG